MLADHRAARIEWLDRDPAGIAIGRRFGRSEAADDS